MTESRRRFLVHSATAGGGLAVMSAADLWAAQSAPTDRIGIGVIGCNGMGFADLQSLLKRPEAECVALCDVDADVLAKRTGEVDTMTGRAPARYGDFRRLLENPNVDAVVIGTPDHWHCLQMVMACEVGKDVYVEKPLANSIEECRIMVAAAERYGRVVQVGQWQRSGPHWEDAIEFLRSGALGRIRTARAWAYMKLDAAGAEGARRTGARRRRLRHVAGPGAPAGVQPEPLPLQLSVVLGLRRRPDDRLGCPPHRHRALGHERHGAAFGRGRAAGSLPVRTTPRRPPTRCRRSTSSTTSR